LSSAWKIGVLYVDLGYSCARPSFLSLPGRHVSSCFALLDGKQMLRARETSADRRAKTGTRDADEGVQSFKNGQYEEAARDFRRAKQLDPKLLNARLYLATTTRPVHSWCA